IIGLAHIDSATRAEHEPRADGVRQSETGLVPVQILPHDLISGFRELQLRQRKRIANETNHPAVTLQRPQEVVVTQTGSNGQFVAYLDAVFKVAADVT